MQDLNLSASHKDWRTGLGSLHRRTAGLGSPDGTAAIGATEDGMVRIGTTEDGREEPPDCLESRSTDDSSKVGS